MYLLNWCKKSSLWYFAKFVKYSEKLVQYWKLTLCDFYFRIKIVNKILWISWPVKEYSEHYELVFYFCEIPKEFYAHPVFLRRICISSKVLVFKNYMNIRKYHNSVYQFCRKIFCKIGCRPIFGAYFTWISFSSI